MSKLGRPTDIFYFASFLYHRDFHSRESLQQIFQDRLGQSLAFETDFSPMKNYYSKEMGKEEDLERYFLISQKLCKREDLMLLKHWAIEVENNHLNHGKRTLNFDIGYLALEQVILATGKPYAHRIYLGEGVYAELTMKYQAQSFGTLPWTYPDYAHGTLIDHFNRLRKTLLKSKP